MPTYYRTNAVLKALTEKPPPHLTWPGPSSWVLLYGHAGQPTALVLVRGETAEEGTIQPYARQLAANAKLAVIDLTFDDNAQEIASVRLKSAAGEYVSTPLRELKKRFAALGLPVAAGTVSKTINKMASSAYHEWQRQDLGAITVSDIDLMRVLDGAVREIVELKRSYIDVEKWQPYAVDFPNFSLVSAFGGQSGADLTIAYNKFVPPNDDISRMSLFTYENKSAKAIGIVTFEEFVAGAY